jgi:hypothetical protein
VPVARYFIDEEPDSTVLTDSSEFGNDLSINFDNAALFEDEEGHRGLHILVAGKEGGASKRFAPDTSVWATDFHGTQQATIELVLDIEEGVGRSIFFLGPIDRFGAVHFSSYMRFTTHIWSEYAVPQAVWSPAPLVGQGRSVVHIVVDYTQEAGADKIVLYVDCVRFENLQTNTVDALSSEASLGAAAEGLEHRFVLGGRRAFSDEEAASSEEEFAGSAMNGVIYYAAVYKEAFDATKRLNNCRTLRDNDDIPRAP